jgi:hypothetical protein
MALAALTALAEDKRKWHEPGWRIEQKYSKGVLIGNWSEEQKEFKKENHVSGSTHRRDFLNYRGQHLPDVIIRRNALARNDGIGRQHLFAHHGKCYSNNMVSMYHDMYNKPWLQDPDATCLRTSLRQYDSNKVSWQPEPIDKPIVTTPYRYGLYEQLQVISNIILIHTHTHKRLFISH